MKELRTFASVCKHIYTHMIHTDVVIAASYSFQAIQVHIKKLGTFASVHKHMCVSTHMIHMGQTIESYCSKLYQINNKIT